MESANAKALSGTESAEDLQVKLAASEAENKALKLAAEARQLVDQHATTANESHASSKERFAIIIDEGRSEFDIDPVPVGVNGRYYQIKRGQLVEVPIEVVGVLNTAVEDKSIPKTDSQGNPAGFDVRKARRFPFQNYGKTVDAEGKRTGLKVPEMAAAA